MKPSTPRGTGNLPASSIAEIDRLLRLELANRPELTIDRVTNEFATQVGVAAARRGFREFPESELGIAGVARHFATEAVKLLAASSVVRASASLPKAADAMVEAYCHELTRLHALQKGPAGGSA
ncbi:MAG: hypothetical protein GY873_39110 [Bosea sp.]|uniref:hypothetical protein n=1 Tax=Bosea sp. (in: a-proteobacteria) TaxID=1871050 RepID=UPI002394AC59|nr:hypothetical protein [Bosea sp. (in: a-proteobacteria)]MCP4740214.1 hypothetical protein [Bosea sp. (in: a-proteobacteria)]